MEEMYYYMTAADGGQARIPARKAKEWTAWQNRIRNNTLTPEDKARMAETKALLDEAFKNPGKYLNTKK